MSSYYRLLSQERRKRSNESFYGYGSLYQAGWGTEAGLPVIYETIAIS